MNLIDVARKLFRLERDVRRLQCCMANGSSAPPNNVTTNTTLGETTSYNLVDASAGAVTITLPTAVGNAGLQHSVKKTDSTANEVIIDAAGSETIDGDLTFIISDPYDSATFVSNGTNWYIL